MQYIYGTKKEKEKKKRNKEECGATDKTLDANILYLMEAGNINFLVRTELVHSGGTNNRNQSCNYYMVYGGCYQQV